MALYFGDVKSNVATSNNTVVAGPARVRGIHYVANTSPGSIVIKNGGSNGSTVLSVATAANAYGNIVIPGDGILCTSNVYAALSNVDSVTIIYG